MTLEFKVTLDPATARILVYLNDVCRDCIKNICFAFRANHNIDPGETRGAVKELAAWGLVEIEKCHQDADGDAFLAELGEAFAPVAKALLEAWYPEEKPKRILNYQCPECGAWHKEPGFHLHTIADQVPEQEPCEKRDNECPGGCSFLRFDNDGEFCILGLQIKPQQKHEDRDKCSPGPECPIKREG